MHSYERDLAERPLAEKRVKAAKKWQEIDMNMMKRQFIKKIDDDGNWSVDMEAVEESKRGMQEALLSIFQELGLSDTDYASLVKAYSDKGLLPRLTKSFLNKYKDIDYRDIDEIGKEQQLNVLDINSIVSPYQNNLEMLNTLDKYERLSRGRGEETRKRDSLILDTKVLKHEMVEDLMTSAAKGITGLVDTGLHLTGILSEQESASTAMYGLFREPLAGAYTEGRRNQTLGLDPFVTRVSQGELRRTAKELLKQQAELLGDKASAEDFRQLQEQVGSYAALGDDVLNLVVELGTDVSPVGGYSQGMRLIDKGIELSKRNKAVLNLVEDISRTNYWKQDDMALEALEYLQGTKAVEVMSKNKYFDKAFTKFSNIVEKASLKEIQIGDKALDITAYDVFKGSTPTQLAKIFGASMLSNGLDVEAAENMTEMMALNYIIAPKFARFGRGLLMESAAFQRVGNVASRGSDIAFRDIQRRLNATSQLYHEIGQIFANVPQAGIQLLQNDIPEEYANDFVKSFLFAFVPGVLMGASDHYTKYRKFNSIRKDNVTIDKDLSYTEKVFDELMKKDNAPVIETEVADTPVQPEVSISPGHVVRKTMEINEDTKASDVYDALAKDLPLDMKDKAKTIVKLGRTNGIGIEVKTLEEGRPAYYDAKTNKVIVSDNFSIVDYSDSYGSNISEKMSNILKEEIAHGITSNNYRNRPSFRTEIDELHSRWKDKVSVDDFIDKGIEYGFGPDDSANLYNYVAHNVDEFMANFYNTGNPVLIETMNSIKLKQDAPETLFDQLKSVFKKEMYLGDKLHEAIVRVAKEEKAPETSVNEAEVIAEPNISIDEINATTIAETGETLVPNIDVPLGIDENTGEALPKPEIPLPEIQKEVVNQEIDDKILDFLKGAEGEWNINPLTLGINRKSVQETKDLYDAMQLLKKNSRVSYSAPYLKQLFEERVGRQPEDIAELASYVRDMATRERADLQELDEEVKQRIISTFNAMYQDKEGVVKKAYQNVGENIAEQTETDPFYYQYEKLDKVYDKLGYKSSRDAQEQIARMITDVEKTGVDKSEVLPTVRNQIADRIVKSYEEIFPDMPASRKEHIARQSYIKALELTNQKKLDHYSYQRYPDGSSYISKMSAPFNSQGHSVEQYGTVEKGYNLFRKKVLDTFGTFLDMNKSSTQKLFQPIADFLGAEPVYVGNFEYKFLDKNEEVETFYGLTNKNAIKRFDKIATDFLKEGFYLIPKPTGDMIIPLPEEYKNLKGIAIGQKAAYIDKMMFQYTLNSDTFTNGDRDFQSFVNRYLPNMQIANLYDVAHGKKIGQDITLKDGTQIDKGIFTDNFWLDEANYKELSGKDIAKLLKATKEYYLTSDNYREIPIAKKIQKFDIADEDMRKMLYDALTNVLATSYDAGRKDVKTIDNDTTFDGPKLSGKYLPMPLEDTPHYYPDSKSTRRLVSELFDYDKMTVEKVAENTKGYKYDSDTDVLSKQVMFVDYEKLAKYRPELANIFKYDGAILGIRGEGSEAILKLAGMSPTTGSLLKSKGYFYGNDKQPNILKQEMHIRDLADLMDVYSPAYKSLKYLQDTGYFLSDSSANKNSKAPFKYREHILEDGTKLWLDGSNNIIAAFDNTGKKNDELREKIETEFYMNFGEITPSWALLDVPLTGEEGLQFLPPDSKEKENLYTSNHAFANAIMPFLVEGNPIHTMLKEAGHDLSPVMEAVRTNAIDYHIGKDVESLMTLGTFLDKAKAGEDLTSFTEKDANMKLAGAVKKLARIISEDVGERNNPFKAVKSLGIDQMMQLLKDTLVSDDMINVERLTELSYLLGEQLNYDGAIDKNIREQTVYTGDKYSLLQKGFSTALRGAEAIQTLNATNITKATIDIGDGKSFLYSAYNSELVKKIEKIYSKNLSAEETSKRIEYERKQMKQLLKTIERDFFELDGTIKAGSHGIIVSRAMLDELSKTAGRRIGLGDRLLGSRVPIDNFDSTAALTIIGISEGTNEVILDPYLKYEVKGIDDDGDGYTLIAEDKHIFKKELFDAVIDAYDLMPMDFKKDNKQFEEAFKQKRGKSTLGNEANKFKFVAPKHSPQFAGYGKAVYSAKQAKQGMVVAMRNKLYEDMLYLQEMPNIENPVGRDPLGTLINTAVQSAVDSYNFVPYDPSELLTKLKTTLQSRINYGTHTGKVELAFMRKAFETGYQLNTFNDVFQKNITTNINNRVVKPIQNRVKQLLGDDYANQIMNPETGMIASLKSILRTIEFTGSTSKIAKGQPHDGIRYQANPLKRTEGRLFNWIAKNYKPRKEMFFLYAPANNPREKWTYKDGMITNNIRADVQIPVKDIFDVEGNKHATIPDGVIEQLYKHQIFEPLRYTLKDDTKFKLKHSLLSRLGEELSAKSNGNLNANLLTAILGFTPVRAKIGAKYDDGSLYIPTAYIDLPANDPMRNKQNGESKTIPAWVIGELEKKGMDLGTPEFDVKGLYSKVLKDEIGKLMPPIEKEVLERDEHNINILTLKKPTLNKVFEVESLNRYKAYHFLEPEKPLLSMTHEELQNFYQTKLLPKTEEHLRTLIGKKTGATRHFGQKIMSLFQNDAAKFFNENNTEIKEEHINNLVETLNGIFNTPIVDNIVKGLPIEYQRTKNAFVLAAFEDAVNTFVKGTDANIFDNYRIFGDLAINSLLKQSSRYLDTVKSDEVVGVIETYVNGEAQVGQSNTITGKNFFSEEFNSNTPVTVISKAEKKILGLEHRANLIKDGFLSRQSKYNNMLNDIDESVSIIENSKNIDTINKILPLLQVKVRTDAKGTDNPTMSVKLNEVSMPMEIQVDDPLQYNSAMESIREYFGIDEGLFNTEIAPVLRTYVDTSVIANGTRNYLSQILSLKAQMGNNLGLTLNPEEFGDHTKENLNKNMFYKVWKDTEANVNKYQVPQDITELPRYLRNNFGEYTTVPPQMEMMLNGLRDFIYKEEKSDTSAGNAYKMLQAIGVKGYDKPWEAITNPIEKFRKDRLAQSFVNGKIENYMRKEDTEFGLRYIDRNKDELTLNAKKDLTEKDLDVRDLVKLAYSVMGKSEQIPELYSYDTGTFYKKTNYVINDSFLKLNGVLRDVWHTQHDDSVVAKEIFDGVMNEVGGKRSVHGRNLDIMEIRKNIMEGNEVAPIGSNMEIFFRDANDEMQYNRTNYVGSFKIENEVIDIDNNSPIRKFLNDEELEKYKTHFQKKNKNRINQSFMVFFKSDLRNMNGEMLILDARDVGKAVVVDDIFHKKQNDYLANMLSAEQSKIIDIAKRKVSKTILQVPTKKDLTTDYEGNYENFGFMNKFDYLGTVVDVIPGNTYKNTMSDKVEMAKTGYDIVEGEQKELNSIANRFMPQLLRWASYNSYAPLAPLMGGLITASVATAVGVPTLGVGAGIAVGAAVAGKKAVKSLTKMTKLLYQAKGGTSAHRSNVSVGPSIKTYFDVQNGNVVKHEGMRGFLQHVSHLVQGSPFPFWISDFTQKPQVNIGETSDRVLYGLMNGFSGEIGMMLSSLPHVSNIKRTHTAVLGKYTKKGELLRKIEQEFEGNPVIHDIERKIHKNYKEMGEDTENLYKQLRTETEKVLSQYQGSRKYGKVAKDVQIDYKGKMPTPYIMERMLEDKTSTLHTAKDYLAAKASVTDLMSQLLFLGDWTAKLEGTSSESAFAQAQQNLRDLTFTDKKADSEIWGDFLRIADYQTFYKDKAIGNYQKTLRQATNLGKAMTMFARFNRKRALDQTTKLYSYRKAMESFIMEDISKKKNGSVEDKKFLDFIRYIGIPIEDMVIQAPSQTMERHIAYGAMFGGLGVALMYALHSLMDDRDKEDYALADSFKIDDKDIRDIFDAANSHAVIPISIAKSVSDMMMGILSSSEAIQDAKGKQKVKSMITDKIEAPASFMQPFSPMPVTDAVKNISFATYYAWNELYNSGSYKKIVEDYYATQLPKQVAGQTGSYAFGLGHVIAGIEAVENKDKPTKKKTRKRL